MTAASDRIPLKLVLFFLLLHIVNQIDRQLVAAFAADNIVMGDWNIVDENDAVLAVENWKTMLKRYDDYCAASGIAPVDITSFAGN